MNTIVRTLAPAGVLALAMATVVAARADDDDDVKNSQKKVLEMVKALEGGKEPTAAQLTAFHKKFDDLDAVMTIYKPSSKKGLGSGKKGPGDGIEQKINNLVKRVPSPAKLKDELIRLGYINSVMADVAKQYAPPKPKGGKGKKEWDAYCADQKQGSKELIAAAKGGDAKKIKAAAKKIADACVSCHADFKNN